MRVVVKDLKEVEPPLEVELWQDGNTVEIIIDEYSIGYISGQTERIVLYSNICKRFGFTIVQDPLDEEE